VTSDERGVGLDVRELRHGYRSQAGQLRVLDGVDPVEHPKLAGL